MNTFTDESSVVTWRGALVRSAHVLWMTVALTGVAPAQTVPFETVTTLSTDVAPIEREFDIPQSGAGQYRIRVTDLGALLTIPGAAPLESVHVLVTRGTTVVATLDGSADPSAVDTTTFDATPGTYAAHVVGRPGSEPGSGPISLLIESVASSTPVVTLGGTLAPPETLQEGVRTYQTEIDVTTAGNYELTLTDLAFPRALETAGVFLFQAGASNLTACLSLPEVAGVCPAFTTVNLAAGRYQVVAAGATPNSSDAGVFSVHFRAAAGGAVIHSRSVEIGRVTRVSPSSFQLDAGAHVLRLNDLQFPAPLSANAAIVTHAAQVTALANASTPEAAFTVASDDTVYDVFAYASPNAAEAAGSFNVEVRTGSSAGPTVLGSIEAIGSSSGSPIAYTFTGDVTTPGSYRARLGDFQFPEALSSARLAVVQNGVVVDKTDAGAPGPMLSLDLADLAAGAVTAIAIVRPAVAGGTVQQSGGTFGLELTSTTGNQIVLDATQGVGGLISTRKVSILQAGRYDLTVSDLDFPEAFRDLMAVISRGAQKLGTVLVGSGGTNPRGGSATLLDFDATVGDYSVTIIAQPADSHDAATYGVTFAQAAPGPTVTLDADPRSVTSGGTTKLTWSSQNATSCTASSNPTGAWTGAKSVAGTENSAAVTAATTFTLRCDGEGGRKSEQSVSVTVAAPLSGGGGGGAIGWLGLFGLAACRALAQVPRARGHSLNGRCLK